MVIAHLTWNTYHVPRLWCTFCNAFGLQSDKKRILKVIKSARQASTKLYRGKGKQPGDIYEYFSYQKGIFKVYWAH